MISKELSAAVTRPLILSILSEGETYGYDIICRVRELSDSEIQWKDGMLYPVLRRLEEQGLVASTWRDGDGQRRRRYYQITSAGRCHLEGEGQQWRTALRTLSKVWEAVPCPK